MANSLLAILHDLREAVDIDADCADEVLRHADRLEEALALHHHTAPPPLHRGAERGPGSASPAPSDLARNAPAGELTTSCDPAEPDVHGGSMAIDDLPVCDVSDPDLDRPTNRFQNDETWEPNAGPSKPVDAYPATAEIDDA